jgi:hypothetical protein
MVEQSRETPAEHRIGETVETKLLRIAGKARKEREFKFSSLYHLMNEELLLECFKRLEENASLPRAAPAKLRSTTAVFRVLTRHRRPTRK